MVRYPYSGNGFTEAPRAGLAADFLRDLYRAMLRIRRIEEEIERRYPEDQMKTPIHLMIGQEAASVGVCAALRKQDLLYCSHRTHGNYLAKGGNLKRMMAELYCKAAGCAGSRGGSMHLLDKSVGMMGSSAICAGAVPIATGAALTAQLRNLDQVVTVFVGDGACEEGVVWESLNYAALRKLPVIYVCENNFYSVCTPLWKRQPDAKLVDKAASFGANALAVDGMNVLEVFEAAQKAVAYAHAGKGPVFIEARLYRWRGHGGVGDDSHTGYRDADEVKEWQNFCPVETFYRYLKLYQMIDSEKVLAMKIEIDEEISEAFAFAISSPVPDVRELAKYVYAP